MDFRGQISRSKALSNVPERKLQEQILHLVQNCKTCSQKNIKVIEQALDGICPRCATMSIAYNRYADSNIPVEYWNFDMKDFQGPAELRKAYENITNDLPLAYKQGISVCFAGAHGLGKTLSQTCILKRACQKNYVCLYTTL